MGGNNWSSQPLNKIQADHPRSQQFPCKSGTHHPIWGGGGLEFMCTWGEFRSPKHQPNQARQRRHKMNSRKYQHLHVPSINHLWIRSIYRSLQIQHVPMFLFPFSVKISDFNGKFHPPNCSASHIPILKRCVSAIGQTLAMASVGYPVFPKPSHLGKL